MRLYGRFSGASRTKNTFDDACGAANSVEDCTHQENVESGIRNAAFVTDNGSLELERFLFAVHRTASSSI
jgi:hypothetical protein